MRIKTAAVIAGIIMWMASPAWAGTINFDFTQGYSGAQGTHLAYTQGGYSVTAYGYQESYGGNSPTDLYVKTSGGDESGLGLYNEDDYEIGPNQFIQLDLTNLAKAGILSGNIGIGSVQDGEGYSIYTSAKVGALGSLELNGAQDVTPFSISWTAADPIIGITAWVPPHGNCDADILVMSLSANTPTSTPEPASLALMGTGLLGLAIVLRRYSKISPAKQ